MMSGAEQDKVVEAYVKTLNQHGHAFQSAVLAEAASLFGNRRSKFRLEVAEFPVAIQDQPTRIDFVLKHIERPLYLVGECKRVNPAFSSWCFSKLPFIRQGHGSEWMVVDNMRRSPAGGFAFDSRLMGRAHRAAHLGVEVRSGERGDTGGPSGRSAIEDAAGQVLRGLNGLAAYCLKDHRVLGGDRDVALIPMIVTTARLWLSDSDLSETDLATGHFPAEKARLEEVPWVVLQYHVSPTLKYEHGSPRESESLSAALRDDFIRSILIVSPAGLASALEWASQLEFNDLPASRT